jgi:hypothetical protein
LDNKIKSHKKIPEKNVAGKKNPENIFLRAKNFQEIFF